MVHFGTESWGLGVGGWGSNPSGCTLFNRELGMPRQFVLLPGRPVSTEPYKTHCFLQGERNSETLAPFPTAKHHAGFRAAIG